MRVAGLAFASGTVTGVPHVLGAAGLAGAGAGSAGASCLRDCGQAGTCSRTVEYINREGEMSVDPKCPHGIGSNDANHINTNNNGGVGGWVGR